MTKVTYRRVVPTFWSDPDVKEVLSLAEKAFLLYLFTNEHAHPCGVYRLRLLYIMDETGLDRPEALAWLRTTMAPFVTYDERTEEVFVHAMADHQIGALHGQDKRIQWVHKQVASIRSDTLRAAFWERYNEWNLDPAALAVPGDLGQSEPAETGGNTRKRKGHRKGLTKGHGKGHGKALSKPAAATAAAAAVEPSSHPPGSGSPARDHGDPPAAAGPPGREDGEKTEKTTEQLVAEFEPMAKVNLRVIRGTTDDRDVQIEAGGETHRVGMGIEINRYRRLAASLPEGPEVVARAIRHLPDVCELTPPISLARWLADDGAPILEQCIHRALDEMPAEAPPVEVKVKSLPPATAGSTEDFERKRQEARRKVEAMKRTERLASEIEGEGEPADEPAGAA